MEKFTAGELETNTRKMQEKIKDDEDFFSKWGSVRSYLPSEQYRKNYDKIFSRDLGKEVRASPATAEE